MSIPPVPKGPFYTWYRPRSHGWVELPLQQRLLSWGLLFVDEHSWVREKSLQIHERFLDNGISVRVPYGPTGPPQEQANFRQRPGLPFIRVLVIRDVDGRVFEVSLSFPQANMTPGIEPLLAGAREALRRQEVSTR